MDSQRVQRERLRIESIRNRAGVVCITKKKTTEVRSQWFGHVRRRKDEK